MKVILQELVNLYLFFEMGEMEYGAKWSSLQGDE